MDYASELEARKAKGESIYDEIDKPLLLEKYRK
jgi:hypothetical protein